MEGSLTRLRAPILAFIVLAAGPGCREEALYNDVPGGGGGASAPITWERTTGPAGEAVLSLRSDPAGVLYAGTASGRLYRTVTDGNIWNAVPLPYSGGAVTSIIIDPLRRMFVANDVHGVYASMDGGGSWVAFNAGLTDTAIYALSYLPGGTFAAGSARGNLSVAAAGTSAWMTAWTFPRAVTSILAVSTDSYYAAVWGAGVYRCSATDSVPVPVNAGLPDLFVNVLHAGAGGYFFAGTRNTGVFRSDPDGIFWQDAGGGSVSRDVAALRTSQYGELFAGTGFGVYRSTDAGLHWTILDGGLGLQEVRSLAIDANARVFAGTGNGVYRSVRHE